MRLLPYLPMFAILTWLGEHFAHGTGGIPRGILDSGALSRGSFQVRVDKILGIANELRRLDDLDGVRLFRYGRYLARPSTESRGVELSSA